LVNVLSPSVNSAVLLASHDYSDCYKTGANIAKHSLKTIQKLGHTMSFEVIANNIQDTHPNIFWFEHLIHTLNLLMHDINMLKKPNYKWIITIYWHLSCTILHQFGSHLWKLMQDI